MTTFTLPKLIRYSLIGIASLFGLACVALLCVYIYLAEPHLRVSEVRSTTTPETVELEWNVRCETSYYQTAAGVKYQPIVPVGGKEVGEGEQPKDFSALVSGNRFVVVGYPYQSLHRNIFTGSITKRHSERFDVIAWSAVIPYTRYNESWERVETTKALTWHSSANPIFTTDAHTRNNQGC